jgi:hypothetical protein
LGNKGANLSNGQQPQFNVQVNTTVTGQTMAKESDWVGEHQIEPCRHGARFDLAKATRQIHPPVNQTGLLWMKCMHNECEWSYCIEQAAKLPQATLSQAGPFGQALLYAVFEIWRVSSSLELKLDAGLFRTK